ncbi:MAG: hypothetical protein K4H23_05380 [Mollicutes bacterium PWAP]|nr:hypothetical protein [Mollicutes bacterium PWAP]
MAAKNFNEYEKLKKIIEVFEDFLISLNDKRNESDDKYNKWEGAEEGRFNIRNYIKNYYNAKEILQKFVPELANDFIKYYHSGFNKENIENDKVLLKRGSDIKFYLESGWMTTNKMNASIIINNVGNYLTSQLTMLLIALERIEKFDKLMIGDKMVIEDSKLTAEWLIRKKLYRSSAILSSVMIESIINNSIKNTDFKPGNKPATFEEKITYLRGEGFIDLIQSNKLRTYYSIRNNIIAHNGPTPEIGHANDMLNGLIETEIMFSPK